MRVAVSRRRLLQLAMAPAFLSRAHAQVQDLAPEVSRVYPGGDGSSSMCRTSRATPFTTPRTPDTAAAAWLFPRCRSERPSGRSPATTRAHVQAAIDRVSSRAPDAQRIPRRRAAQGRLLPDGHATAHPGERRGAARRRHGRHRHHPRSAPARDGPRPLAVRWPADLAAAPQGTLVRDRRRVGRDDEGRHASRRSPTSTCRSARAVSESRRPAASGRATRSSCGASATRRGSMRSA